MRKERKGPIPPVPPPPPPQRGNKAEKNDERIAELEKENALLRELIVDAYELGGASQKTVEEIRQMLAKGTNK